MKKLSDSFGKFIGFAIIAGIITAIISLFSFLGGILMKIFGFTYHSVGSIILFFVVSGLLSFPIEIFVKAIPRVLFLRFKKINEFEAKLIFIISDTLLSTAVFSSVDYFMVSVSASPLSIFVISLIMALMGMNDVTENKDS